MRLLTPKKGLKSITSLALCLALSSCSSKSCTDTPDRTEGSTRPVIEAQPITPSEDHRFADDMPTRQHEPESSPPPPPRQKSCDAETCLRDIDQVAAGEYHSCALTREGKVLCWGGNQFGQLGNGTKTARLTPTRVPGLDHEITAISAGAWYTCALNARGEVYCWGDNASGQLGNGNTEPSDGPVQVTGLSDVTSISTGQAHACAVTSKGEAFCWGSDLQGRLGTNAKIDITGNAPVKVGELEQVVAISAGEDHTCAVDHAGEVFCWGANSHNQLGNGEMNLSSTPVQVEGLAHAASVSAGAFATCATTSKGEVFCWGSNNATQLGVQLLDKHITPLKLSHTPDTISSVSMAMAYHVCALTSNKEVLCWGNNFDGQLGDGRDESTHTPARVSKLSDVAHISSGAQHSCAVTTRGDAYCWGNNKHGQLGDGSTQRARSPIPVHARAPSDLDSP